MHVVMVGKDCFIRVPQQENNIAAEIIPEYVHQFDSNSMASPDVIRVRVMSLLEDGAPVRPWPQLTKEPVQQQLQVLVHGTLER